MPTSLSVPKLTLRAVKGSPLTNDEMDANLQVLKDFANGLSALLGTSLNSDGTLKVSVIPETSLNDRIISQRKLKTDFNFASLSTGAANTFAVTFVPAITSYTNGQVFFIAAHQPNTGAATLQVDALAAVPILKLGGLPLLGGEIISSGVFVVVYWDFGGGGKFYMLHGAPTNPVNTSADSGSGTGGYGIPNGSMETDADADGKPDQWVFTAYTGGAGALDSTDQAHSGKSFKFTADGVLGHGGGNLVSANFIEVTPNRYFGLSWQMKSSQSTLTNKIEIDWFTAAQVLISTSTLYNENSNQVAAWTLFAAGALPPSTARYCKIRLIGGYNTAPAVAGSVWFDDVRIEKTFDRGLLTLTTAGNGTWKAPDGVRVIQVEVIGNGGGVVPANGNVGGGGAGGYAKKIMAVVPGTSYAFSIPAPSGGPCVFNGVTANPGAPGGLVAFGAGGSATGGDLNVPGGNGSLSDPCDGGVNPQVGVYGAGAGGSGTQGKSSLGPNGGAGGYIWTGSVSGATPTGGPAMIVIRY